MDNEDIKDIIENIDHILEVNDDLEEDAEIGGKTEEFFREILPASCIYRKDYSNTPIHSILVSKVDEEHIEILKKYRDYFFIISGFEPEGDENE